MSTVITPFDGPHAAVLLAVEDAEWLLDLVGQLPVKEQSAVRCYQEIDRAIDEQENRAASTEGGDEHG